MTYDITASQIIGVVIYAVVLVVAIVLLAGVLRNTRTRFRYAYKCDQCGRLAFHPAQYDPCQRCGGKFDDLRRVTMERVGGEWTPVGTDTNRFGNYDA